MSRWKPENNEIYYFVSTSGTVEYLFWDYSTFDSKLYNAGNYFRTKSEAEAAAEKVKALLLSLHKETEEAKKQDIELPEWCKVGEWAYFDNQYTQIEKIDTEICVSPVIDFSNGARKAYEPFCLDNVKQARMRPFNADEMKALVGKVIEHKKDLHLVTNYLNDTADNEPVVCVGTNWRDAKGLIEHNYTIEGNPCGVLEHLEDREWVE